MIYTHVPTKGGLGASSPAGFDDFLSGYRAHVISSSWQWYLVLYATVVN